MSSSLKVGASYPPNRLLTKYNAFSRALVTVHGIVLPPFVVLDDAKIVTAMVCLRNRIELFDALSGWVSCAVAGTQSEEIQSLGLFAILVTVALVAYTSRNNSPGLSKATDLSRSYRQCTLQPQLFPCRTTHTRLFPKKHSFSYSYLYAGIPVGWTGTVRSLLSADTADPAMQDPMRASRGTWFSVDGRDHLQRSDHQETLVQKLHEYLSSQGSSAAQYSYVFLVTAPRFLGFSFNPVSFWYLYSEQKQLITMILEVNNTFGERRMYLMDHTLPRDEQSATCDDVFSHTWYKDFHVSPFNDRDGVYVLRAKDPFAPDLSGQGCIDNTITLLAPDGKPKLVARVFSDSQPILASNMSTLQALRFVSNWWWVGFMTNVRIVKEARNLWQKNLEVFYRPEVRLTSIARQASDEENSLAESFLIFLRYLQKISASLHSIRYTAAAGSHRGVPITISRATEPMSERTGLDRVINIYVVTPAFYTSFVQVPDPVEAFRQLCLCKLEKERLAILSSPEVILEQVGRATNSVTRNLEPIAAHDCHPRDVSPRHQVLRRMASLVATISPIPDFSPTLGSSSLAPFDLVNLAESKQDSQATSHYIKTVLSVLLAKEVALGSMGLFRAYRQILRALLLWMVSCALQAIGLRFLRTLSLPFTEQ